MDKKDLKAIISAGHMAPSADNSQPWIFDFENNHVFIHHDLERASANHLYNIDYFADYVSIGCVIENMTIAAHRFGYTSDIISIDIENGGLSVSLEFKKTHEPYSYPRYESISKRKTSRHPYHPRPIPENIKKKLISRAKKKGVKLHWVDDQENISRLAHFIARHDIILWEDPALRENLLKMLRNRKNGHRDGLPVDSLELGVKKHLFGPAIAAARRFSPLWKTLSFNSVTHTRNNTRKSGAIGLLTVAGEHRPDAYIKGGQALQSIWIDLTEKKIHMQPIFGSLSLILNKRLGRIGLSKKHENIRDEVSGFFHHLFPDLKESVPTALFRAGYSKNPTAVSGRRNLSEVLKKSL